VRRVDSLGKELHDQSDDQAVCNDPDAIACQIGAVLLEQCGSGQWRRVVRLARAAMNQARWAAFVRSQKAAQLIISALNEEGEQSRALQGAGEAGGGERSAGRALLAASRGSRGLTQGGCVIGWFCSQASPHGQQASGFWAVWADPLAAVVGAAGSGLAWDVLRPMDRTGS